jgi:hypothetical protein
LPFIALFEQLTRLIEAAGAGFVRLKHRIVGFCVLVKQFDLWWNEVAKAARPWAFDRCHSANGRTDIRPPAPHCRIASLEGTAAPSRSPRGFACLVNLVYDGNIHDA